MFKSGSLLAIFGLCTIALGGLAQPPMPNIPASQEAPAGMLTVQSEADVPDPVSIQQVVYATRDGTNLELKILSPAGVGGGLGPPRPDAPRVPLVVYVQGSAWFAQDTSQTLFRMAKFVEQSGYVVASAQYRPSTIAKAPAQLQDIKSAIRYLRANAQRFGIDPDRVAIWGDSSGGHIAAMVGTTAGETQFDTPDNAGFSSEVKAVVDFFGPTDFLQMSRFPSVLTHDAADSPESTVIGGPIGDAANRDKVAMYNPISYISTDSKLPPFLIMHGDVDALVPFNQSVLLYEALKAANQPVTFYKVLGGGHEIRFWTPAVYRIVQEFLAQHLQ